MSPASQDDNPICSKTISLETWLGIFLQFDYKLKDDKNNFYPNNDNARSKAFFNEASPLPSIEWERSLSMIV